jgi:hypothetical protein
VAKRIYNPHDLFLKATLSSPRAIQDFFQAYFPAHLRKYVDFSSIQPAQESHILPSLKQLANDLIFTCQIGQNLAILVVEHQSTADWRMPLRFLKYIAAIIDEYMKDKPTGTPWPFILNFCIYHDILNKPYPYATSSYDCFPNALLAQEMDILVRFNLLNLSTSQDASLESHGTFSLLEKLFKYRKEDNLFQIAEYELERCRDWVLGRNMPAAPLGADYWQFIFYYLSNVLDPEHVSEEKLIYLFEEKLFINKEVIMRTIAQQIEKRGEEKKAIFIAESMFKDGEPLPKIMKWTGLSKEAIEQLIKQLKKG